MDALALGVAATRNAPIQCMAWGHPITSGLPTMDYFLTSQLMEPSDGQSHYSEKLIELPGLSIEFAPPHRAAQSSYTDPARTSRGQNITVELSDTLQALTTL